MQISITGYYIKKTNRQIYGMRSWFKGNYTQRYKGLNN